jgi:multidrug efflux pump subunit AcrB
MLFITGTTLSVPALTGAIMCMGVATANSILVVSFARERLDALGDATRAALEAGQVRIRPVLMTALVASLGFVPMAVATSAGAEVQRPLATVVIGRLVTSTILTLLVLPVAYPWFSPRDAAPEPGSSPQ